jgi:hypothetical protein
MKNWPDESTNFYPNNNNNNPVSNKSSLNSPKDIQSNEITTNHTVKSFDQLPEYKLFSSNGPSIHSILFGNNGNPQPVMNGIDHDLREIEKRLMGKIK